MPCGPQPASSRGSPFHSLGMSEAIMRMLTVLWHDAESSGFTDILPAEWFRREGAQIGYVHQVRGPRGGSSTAKCDLLIGRTYADLNYEAYPDFNLKQGNLLGFMRLQFASNAREAVTQVFWKEKGTRAFQPLPTTVGALSDDTGLKDLDDIEGRPYLASHVKYERSSKLIAKKKAA